FDLARDQDVLLAHVYSEPRPLSARNPRVPAALAALVSRCLNKRPADRPPDGAALARELAAIDLAGPDLSSAPTMVTAVLAAPPPRRQVLGLAAALMAISGALALWLTRPVATPEPRRPALVA